MAHLCQPGETARLTKSGLAFALPVFEMQEDGVARLGHGAALGISRRETVGQIGDDDAECVLVAAAAAGPLQANIPDAAICARTSAITSASEAASSRCRLRNAPPTGHSWLDVAQRRDRGQPAWWSALPFPGVQLRRWLIIKDHRVADLFGRWCDDIAEAEQVGITRGPVRRVVPEREQQCALEQKIKLRIASIWTADKSDKLARVRLRTLPPSRQDSRSSIVGEEPRLGTL